MYYSSLSFVLLFTVFSKVTSHLVLHFILQCACFISPLDYESFKGNDILPVFASFSV